MDMKKLLEQIDEWYDNGKHQKIIGAILEIPEEKRDYFLNGQLAVAYNNIGNYNKANYDKAKRILLSTEEEGKTDYRWYYRLGYAYCYGPNRTNKIGENFRIAKSYFEKANELCGGSDEDIIDLIDECSDELDDLNKDTKAEKILLKLKNGKLGEEYEVKIYEQALGILNLPTGKIVANDPLTFFEYEPFATTVPIGKYPVFVHVSCPYSSNDKRVAFAEIRFTENPPVRFELALLNELEKASSLDTDNDYGVDSATGCFMDYETCMILKDKVDQHTGNDMIAESAELENALEETSTIFSTANKFLSNTENNIVAFSSGFGDGGYFSYWGFDEKNEICCLITDFDMF